MSGGAEAAESAATPPEDSQAEGRPFSFSEFEREADRGTVSLLRSIWINEKCAPEVLIYEDKVVAQIKSLVESQQEYIASRREESKGTEDFQCNLYQMELDRINFMLSCYLRIRLKKIEKYAMWLLKRNDVAGILSPHELRYATQYLNLLEKHFNICFLDFIHPKFRSLTGDTAGGDEMVRAPNLTDFVFLRVKEDIGVLDLSEDGDEVNLSANDILAGSYLPFKGLLLEDKVELI